MNTLVGIFLYLFSFVSIWYGAGLIVKSVDKIAHKLRLSSFAVAFFVLGSLTSIPETAVSINAVMDHSPEIFVGTLLGGSIVIFLLIIPILAILGNGVSLNHDLDKNGLIKLLAIIAAPGLVVIDHKVTNLEGIILILLYLSIIFIVRHKKPVSENLETKTFTSKNYSFVDLAKVALGVGIILISSQFIVNQTLAYAEMLKISAFYISIVVLSIGTNLPELSLAIRAILSGKKDIAFGDYLGSATTNTLLFGAFTLVNNGEVFTFNSFAITFSFLLLGLILFYLFSTSKKDISRKEGIILFLIYLAFVAYEIFTGSQGGNSIHN